MSLLSTWHAVGAFLAFALAYFFSTLIRAITATLSPTLTQEFALSARDLGLLAGGYFLGFALTQLPLGNWLDRYGPKKVILCFLSVAVAGCAAFAMADNFPSLLVARVLSGVGVSACLMAPLTGFRRWLTPATLLRANSWMLMTGSLGMVAATLPVQWLMPIWGWRPLFLMLALLVAVAMLVIVVLVPAWRAPPAAQTVTNSYAEVWQHPYFRKLVPMGFFNYGGMVAIQTLWAGPWMIRVAGYTPVEAATGLFWLNVSMLLTFLLWGLLNPGLARRGWSAERLIQRLVPVSLLVMASMIMASASAGQHAARWVTLFCVSSTSISLAQPAVGMAFPPALAGRALSAYNLVIFSGVFAVQWGIGLIVDGLKWQGWAEPAAFQGAMAVYLLCSLGAYVYFLMAKSHNQGNHD
jgi:MFS family permease